MSPASTLLARGRLDATDVGVGGNLGVVESGEGGVHCGIVKVGLERATNLSQNSGSAPKNMTVTRDMVRVIWNGFAIALRLDTCGDLHGEGIYFGSGQWGHGQIGHVGRVLTIPYQLKLSA